MTVGEAFTIRLNGILKERGITLHKFLKDNAIPRSTIVNIQKGNTKSPTLAIVYQVAYALDMNVIEFLNDPIMLDTTIDFM